MRRDSASRRRTSSASGSWTASSQSPSTRDRAGAPRRRKSMQTPAMAGLRNKLLTVKRARLRNKRHASELQPDDARAPGAPSEASIPIIPIDGNDLTSTPLDFRDGPED